MKNIQLNHLAGSTPLYFREGSSDEAVIQQIFVNQDYSCGRLSLNSQISEFVAANVARGLKALILDLGANIGASSVWFLQNYVVARVVAVEPDEGNFELLTRNTNGLDCVAVKGVVASEKGYASIHDPGLGHWGLRTKIDSIGQIETFTVPELIEQHGGNSFFPFIVKIDIEGAEAELFSKNTDWIDTFPIIIIELHDWLLPGMNTSRNFLQCISSRARDFVYIGENVFSIQVPLGLSEPARSR